MAVFLRSKMSLCHTNIVYIGMSQLPSTPSDLQVITGLLFALEIRYLYFISIYICQN